MTLRERYPHSDALGLVDTALSSVTVKSAQRLRVETGLASEEVRKALRELNKTGLLSKVPGGYLCG